MTMLKSLIAASVVGSAHAFWRMECPGRVGLARMDPIVDPGEVSAHVHAIHGSGAFDLKADTASLFGGDCTSCRVTQDKSSYWAPAMYFKDADTGEFEIVEQVGGMLAYYLLNGEDIKAFPTDFRMVAGDNFRRNFTAGDPSKEDPAKSTWAALGQTDQKDLEQRALGFNCLNYATDAEETLERHFLPEKEFLDANCKDGLRLEIMFPSCWNGKDTQADDFKSHVAYPDLVMSGNCPDTHPVRLPGLLFETIWGTDAFEGRNGMFVMSNGDPTGFGYHGDFIMGWEEDFLQKAVDTCTNESGMIQDCPIFDIIDESKAKECEIKMPLELVAEKVLDGLSLLPGDVQITYEGDSAEPAKPSSSSSAPGLLPSDPADLLPGNVFKESSASTSTTSQDVAAAAAPAPTTTTSTSTSSPTPTTTPTPSVAPVDPSVSYESTQYITNGNMVTKILWDEEVVWVTEMVDTTTTVTITGGPPPSPTPDPTPEPAAAAPAGTDAKRRRHVHHHGHNHHRL